MIPLTSDPAQEAALQRMQEAAEKARIISDLFARQVDAELEELAA